MRRSVERRQASLQRTEPRRSFWRRRIILIISIPALLALAGGANYYLYNAEAAAIKEREATQKHRLAQIDAETKYAIQKKIDDARKAEEEAKKKAAEEEAKRKAAAANKPSGTTAKPAAVCDVTEPARITVVVNKKHCFTPVTWAPGDLASVQGYLLRAEAAGQMTAMMNAATAAGAPFGLSSAYRSYNDQVITYNNWVRVNGSQAAADTVSARPGYSEHQTGLAADVKVGGCVLECFRGTSAHVWLQTNAHNYGFIERYPPGLASITGYSPEAWHWRYVGVATATDMKTKGIQTLEQYFGISGGDYS